MVDIPIYESENIDNDSWFLIEPQKIIEDVEIAEIEKDSENFNTKDVVFRVYWRKVNGNNH